MPSQQALESIFSPLAGLLNSLIPSPWYRGFKVAFAENRRKIYLSRVGNAIIFLSVSISGRYFLIRGVDKL
jgi:hypothetical protein